LLLKVLGISGSLRDASHNTSLLRAAAELFDADEVDFSIYDGLKRVPPYDEDDDAAGAPEAVTRLREAVAATDAILFATPEYNSSVPGHLKNALDWVSRPIATNPLRNTPVAVIGASTGMFGAVWAQADLRKVTAAIGARVLEVELAVGHAHTRFDADGRLIDDDIRRQLQAVVKVLVEQTLESQERAAAA
jgi:chromate reductase, NAD(P)H dehydrogenase (quinone)